MERIEQGQEKVTAEKEVRAKRPDAWCTTHWGRRIVTKVLSKNKVTVDGVPHCVLDIRRVSLLLDEEVVDKVPKEEPV